MVAEIGPPSPEERNEEKCFGEILERHGHRNTGVNLGGFIEDLDAYLEDTDLFESVEIVATHDDDCMLLTTCRAKPGITRAEVEKGILLAWESDLPYAQFEDHFFEDTDKSTVIFHFVTLAPSLGVTGRIECGSDEW